MNKIQLARYGGLSPVKQTHYTTDYENMSYHGAPERYGFYSFLFPYIDWFLLTSETGKLKNREKDFKNKRDMLNVPYKKFSVDGYIWTHIEPIGKLRWMCEDTRGDWFKVHSSNFPILFKKHYAAYTGLTQELYTNQYDSFKIPNRGRQDIKLTVKSPFKHFSTDHLEIFVPKGTIIKNF